MKNRLQFLDALRVLSVALVMYGHFVSVGGGASTIAGVISSDVRLPVFDGAGWLVPRFEVWLIEVFSTQAAVLGVTLFFIVTGYLMPAMMERYERREFLINRVFRIFPTLGLSLLVVGLWVYWLQGVTFSLAEFLSSFTLSFFYTGIPAISGVLWTLAIEVVFYGIVFLTGRFSLRRLYVIQAILVAIVAAAVVRPGVPGLWILGYQAEYLLLIAVGVAIFLGEKEGRGLRGGGVIGAAAVFAYAGFMLFSHAEPPPPASNYGSFGNILLSLLVFSLFWYLGGLVRAMPRAISWLSDLVYPIYLVHVAIGLTVMVVARDVSADPYWLVSIAIFASLIVAWLLHVIVERPGIAIGRKITRRLGMVRSEGIAQ